MKKLLVMHCGGGAGDLLMMTPLLSALKRGRVLTSKVKDEDLTPFLSVMVRGNLREVLEGNPDVDEILVDEPKFSGLPGVFKLASFLRSRKFEAVVLPWTTARDVWGAALAGIPERVGQGGRLFSSFLLTHRVRVRSAEGDEETHWSEILLDYARILGIEPPSPKLVLDIPEEIKNKAERILREAGYREERPLIGLHAFKGIPLTSGRWPLGWFAAVGDALSEKFGGRILLTGSPSEALLVKEISKLMKHPPLDVSGRTSLRELAAVISHCDLFVCPDSGPMHLAAARGIPTVALFALREDFPARWRPLGTRYEVLRPASWRCMGRCIKAECPAFTCYEEIPPGQVVEAAKKLLAQPAVSCQPSAVSPEISSNKLKADSCEPIAVFLDRDGTIIEDADFLSDPEEIKFIADAPEALRSLQEAGFRLVLISNQSGVARGYFTEETVRRIHERLEAMLGSYGVTLAGIYYCPHLPEGAVREYRRECECRKPQTGMIQRAVGELGIDLRNSYLVGDKSSDLEAGRRAGCRTVLVRTGKGAITEQALLPENRPDFVADDMGEAARWIIKKLLADG